MENSQINLDWLANKPVQFKIAQDIDFYALFLIVKKYHKDCYLFESIALPRHQDRYHTIGFSPALTFSARGNKFIVDGETDILRKSFQSSSPQSFDTENPYKMLQNLTKKHLKKPCLTHQGGLIGYFCHEAVNYFDKGVSLPEHELFETFKLGLYFDGLIYDSTTAVVSYYTFAEDRSAQVLEYLSKLPNYKAPIALKKVVFQGDVPDKATFISGTERTIEKIRNGYSFQAEVGFKSHYTIEGDKSVIYSKLREINPSPYMYYMQFGEQTLLGASPEILISSKQGVILTTPTAGTISRGKSSDEDMLLARQLLSDTKEIAEHNMLVDLHRNDVASVSQSGTVKITNLMYIIRFSHVQHIVSDVIGLQRLDKDAFDVLAAILPGGVVTGAPKRETIRIIQENEGVARGPYGGAVGRFSFNSDCDFCLPIRSLFCAADMCYAQTSAGIVYDSIAEKEYIEVINKLAAMKKVLNELGDD